MPAGGVKDDASQRNHKHVADICCRVADDRHQKQHWGKQAARSDSHKPLQKCPDESGVLSDTDSQQCHKNDSKRCKAGEHRHHAGQETGQAWSRELVLDRERPRSVLGRNREFVARQQPRNDPDRAKGYDEERGGVRQAIADPLNPEKSPLDPGRR